MQPRVDRLSVVMPVYNEQRWVERAVRAVEISAERAGVDLEVIVVDDGSTDRTVGILDDLAASGRIRLIRQENAGRLAARAAGLEAAQNPWTLLLDARVLIDADALAYLADAVGARNQAHNAHVDVASEGNPWAAFWSGITKVGWRRYFANPRHVEFGPEEFDAYPKGTGAFLAPTALLRSATESFDSLFADARFASDDTRLLRRIAAEVGIVLDPRFRVDYHGRDSLRRWVQQVYFRGTTFVDGYLHDPRRAVPMLIAIGAVSAGGALLVWRAPRLSVVGWALAECAAGAVTARCGGTTRESAAVMALAVPFTLVFTAGAVRGLVMVARR